ncbi:MAG: EAL domain-containing protein [Gammaproteobacteria bacterium]|nr:EAL domain-containing protein [Gammaproteobacteria bacterium]
MRHGLWGETLTNVLRARSLSSWLAEVMAVLSPLAQPQRLVVVQWQQHQPLIYGDHDGANCTLIIDQPPRQLSPPLPLQEIMPLADTGEPQVIRLESCGRQCLVVPLTLSADAPTVLCICLPQDASPELLALLIHVQRPLSDTFALMVELERLQQLRQQSAGPTRLIDLQPLIDNAPALIAVKDLSGNMLLVNRRFEQLKAPAPDQMVGANLFKLFAKERASVYWHNDLEVLRQRRALEFEEDIEHVDGSIHTYLSMKFPLFDNSGEIWALGTVSFDITSRKQAEQQLRESEQRLRVLLRHAPDAILIFDVDQQRYIDANRTAERLFGLSRDALLALGPVALSPPVQADGKESQQQRQRFIDQTLKGEAPRCEWQYRHADGHLISCETAFVTLPMGRRRIVRESLIDVSSYKCAEQQLREQEKRLAHLAHHDHLTGLPNRLLLQDRLNHSLAVARRHGNRVGLMLFDLDKFKDINDTFGHDVGDQYLVAIAKRLRHSLRAMDTAARIGGDEFVVTVESFSMVEDLARIAQKLLELISETLQLAGQDFNPALSIGISVFPDDASDAETLLKHADIAMYRAKEAGGHQFRLYTGLLGQHHRYSAQLEHHLHQAVALQQLSLVYQPVVELVSGRVTSMEAQLRWHHPQRGQLYPHEFLPLAEDNGTIWEIDRWVVRQLHSQWLQWRNGDAPLPRLSLNLSTHQSLQRQTLRLLDDLLAEQPEFAQVLDLEMGEQLLLDGSDETERLLRQLAARGVSLTIDEFGCGCMSLLRLQQLPVSRLKISTVLIGRLPSGRSETAMVCGLLAMARQLGLKTVAKGVEREEQQQFLLAQGCDEMQGNLLTKALLPGDCGRWLTPAAPLH